jgi:hypothetical protein
MNKRLKVKILMSKKTSERPVFPFTSIVGQEEICVFNTFKQH